MYTQVNIHLAGTGPLKAVPKPGKQYELVYQRRQAFDIENVYFNVGNTYPLQVCWSEKLYFFRVSAVSKHSFIIVLHLCLACVDTASGHCTSRNY